MKNIFTTILLLLSFTAFSQTTMTVHTASGSTDYLLSDIDSITYNNGGGGSGGGSYSIGDTGPAGGLIFHDKGSFSNGWRYLEMSLNNLNNASWGCDGLNIPGTQDVVGSGESNTAAIINDCSTPGIAAKICNNYILSNAGNNYDDWFLPSIEELSLIYNAAQSNVDIYNSFIAGAPFYWSSTQFSSSNSWSLITSSGTLNSNYNKTDLLGVKAVRKF